MRSRWATMHSSQVPRPRRRVPFRVNDSPRVIDLGRMPYDAAYRVQCRHLDDVLGARAAGTPEAGRILLVEHEPVVTVSRRESAKRHLVATPHALAHAGVAVADTDRGGDITYHGPGQLVAYPILDLNLLNLGLHDYMRLLEAAVIDACTGFGVPTCRDPSATGVWTVAQGGAPAAKLCAMGVRVKRWVSMHGLALNVETNLDHFGLIVPCGLAGRRVTSLRQELGERAPMFDAAKAALAASLVRHVAGARERAELARLSAGAAPATR